MHLRQDIKRLGGWLNRDFKLSPIQLLALIVLLAIPVLLIVDSTYRTRYELQANYKQLDGNQALLEELTLKNRQASQELEEKDALIEKQLSDIKHLKSSNQELSGTLALTQSELEAEQDKCQWGDWECYFETKKDKKKHD
ncbi:MAG TPA: hypothetical protein VF996_01235 [Candidatus Saccharimonadales bacterium]